MTKRLTTHDEFMVLIQSCINGELVLTVKEIMDYADECTLLSSLESLERLSNYTDYLNMRISKVEQRGLIIA